MNITEIRSEFEVWLKDCLDKRYQEAVDKSFDYFVHGNGDINKYKDVLHSISWDKGMVG
jgi:hypothetical protein